jgi:hypothetical protein
VPPRRKRPPRRQQKPENEAAEVLRRLLEAIDRGELSADTPQERRLLRRIEGAAAAWAGENRDE